MGEHAFKNHYYVNILFYNNNNFLNLYLFNFNDPIGNTDPNGLISIKMKIVIEGCKKLKKTIKVPRNFKLAGKKHPKTNIPFNADGYPDFSSVAKVTKKIKQTGDRAIDEAGANKAAGLNKTPDGYTWHHVEDGSTMQLVLTEIHKATGHTGGVAMIKKIGSTVITGIIIGLEVLDALDPFSYLTSGDMDPPPGFRQGAFGTWIKIECEDCDKQKSN